MALVTALPQDLLGLREDGPDAVRGQMLHGAKRNEPTGGTRASTPTRAEELREIKL